MIYDKRLTRKDVYKLAGVRLPSAVIPSINNVANAGAASNITPSISGANQVINNTAGVTGVVDTMNAARESAQHGILSRGAGIARNVTNTVNKVAPAVGGVASEAGQAVNTVGKYVAPLGRIAGPAAVASLANEGRNYFADPLAKNKEVADHLQHQGVLGRVGYGLANPGESILAAAGNTGGAIAAAGELNTANKNYANTYNNLSKTREGQIGLMRNMPLPSLDETRKSIGEGPKYFRGNPYGPYKKDISSLPSNPSVMDSAGNNKVANEYKNASILELLSSLDPITGTIHGAATAPSGSKIEGAIRGSAPGLLSMIGSAAPFAIKSIRNKKSISYPASAAAGILGWLTGRQISNGSHWKKNK